MLLLNESGPNHPPLNETVPYGGYFFKIRRETDSYDGDISLACYADVEDELSPGLASLVLRPLWLFPWDEENPPYKEKFEEGDYFQQTITRNQKKTEPHFAEILHEFLLEHAAAYGIRNVYSTNEHEDKDFNMSDGAVDFWRRRIDKGAAEADTQLHRNRIVWA
jgi:hypothetical protein